MSGPIYTTKTIDLAPIRRALPTRHQGLIDRVPTLYEQKDLPGLCKVVTALEQAVRNKTLLVPVYESACGVAAQLGDHSRTAEFALQVMRFGEGQVLNSATGFLDRVGLSFAEGQQREAEQQQIRTHFHRFFRNEKNFIKLQQLPAHVQASWLVTMGFIFNTQYLSEQMTLADTIFARTDDQTKKTAVALTHVLLARKVFAIERKRVEVVKVRAMAEHVLAQGPEQITDRAMCSEEYFDNFIVSLAMFDLFDLIEQAMQIRQPEDHLPVHLYVDLLRKTQQDLKSAYLESEKLEDRLDSLAMSGVLQAAFQLLFTKVTRDYMESIKIGQRQFELELEPSDYYEKVYLTPVSGCPAVAAQITSLRRSALAVFAKLAMNAKYFGSSSTARNILGHEFKANIIHLPGTNRLEVYVFTKDESDCVKAYFVLKLNVKGEVCGIEPQLFLDGVKPKDRQSIILFWEYVTLELLVRSQLYESLLDEADVDESSLHELGVEIYETSQLIALRENFAAFQAIEEQFVEEEAFREREVELNNCYRLARMIFESFVTGISPATYELTEQDFLANLFASITFVDPREPEKASQDITIRRVLEDRKNETENTFPFTVILKDRGGSQIIVQVKSADEIEVLGQNSTSINALLQKYVLELVFSAAAKLFTDISRTEPGTDQGALVFGAGVEDAAGPEQILRKISQTGLLNMAKQKGFHILPWCCVRPASIKKDEKEVLFYPFADQSLENKRKLFEESDPAEIFAQADFFGSIRVLPVSRRKLRNGGFIFRPKNRTAIREQQKALLADNEPFKTFYQLYIKTTFSDAEGDEFVQIITPHVMREDEDEIWSDELFGELEREIKAGTHAAKPIELLKGRSGEKRRKLEARIRSGELTIFEQEVEVFEINTTYHRPKMVSLAELLEQGYVLER